MVHNVACCHECGKQISARDHCPVCNEGNKGSYQCPHCQGYILVGEHSITVDRKRMDAVRLEKLRSLAVQMSHSGCADRVKAGHEMLDILADTPRND